MNERASGVDAERLKREACAFDPVKFHAYEQMVAAGGFTMEQMGSVEERKNIERTLRAGHAERIRRFSSISQLVEYFENHEIEFENEWEGMDRSEHLVKRLSMAHALSSSSLVPEVMGLKEKVHALLEENDRLESIDQKKYADYIRTHQPSLELTPEELKTIIEKVSPSLFASFDPIAERSLLILNALPGTTTENSCAGHQKAVIHNVYFGDQYLSATAFLTYQTTDASIEASLSNRLRSLQIDQGVTHLNTSNTQHRYQLRYRIDAPTDWQDKHPGAIYTASDEATGIRESFFRILDAALMGVLQEVRAIQLER